MARVNGLALGALIFICAAVFFASIAVSEALRPGAGAAQATHDDQQRDHHHNNNYYSNSAAATVSAARKSGRAELAVSRDASSPLLQRAVLSRAGLLFRPMHSALNMRRAALADAESGLETLHRNSFALTANSKNNRDWNTGADADLDLDLAGVRAVYAADSVHHRYHPASVAQQRFETLASTEPASSTSQSSSSAATTNAIVKLKRKLPRKTFSGKDAPKEFSTSDTAYFEGIATLAIGPAAIAILSLLCGVLFCCARGICNCCGSRKPNPKGYSKRTRIVAFVFVVLFGTLVIVGSILGLAGIKGSTSNIRSILDTIIKYSQELVDVIAALITKVTVVQERYGEPAPDAGSLQAEAQDKIDYVKDIRVDVDKYSKNADQGFTAMYALCIVCIVGTLVAALLRLPVFPMVFALFGFFLLFLIWIVVTIVLPLGVVLADGCTYLDEFLNGNSTSKDDPALNSILGCLNGQGLTQSGGINDRVADGIQQSVDLMNTNIDSTNKDIAALNAANPQGTQVPPLPFVTYNDTTGDVFDQIAPISDQVNVINATVSAIEGLSPDAKKAVSNSASRLVDYASLVPDIKAVSNCSIINNMVTDLRFYICKDLIKNLDVCLAGSFLAGLGFIVAIPFMIRGNKRWRKRTTYQEAYTEDVHGEDEQLVNKAALAATGGAAGVAAAASFAYAADNNPYSNPISGGVPYPSTDLPGAYGNYALPNQLGSYEEENDMENGSNSKGYVKLPPIAKR